MMDKATMRMIGVTIARTHRRRILVVQTSIAAWRCSGSALSNWECVVENVPEETVDVLEEDPETATARLN